MGRLAKFWSLTRREKEFLCEASILLLLSNTCVKSIAFRHIDRFLRRWNDGIQSGIDSASKRSGLYSVPFRARRMYCPGRACV